MSLRQRFSFLNPSIFASPSTVAVTTAGMAGSVALSFLSRSLHTALLAAYTHRNLLTRTALCVLALALLYDGIGTTRRQRSDATSEWGRYARYPTARGRAMAKLALLQIVPRLLRIRFVARTEEHGMTFSTRRVGSLRTAC
jgi:hypothetical protein